MDLNDDLGRYLATVEELLIAERMHQAAEIIGSAEPRIEHSHHDSWDGGTDYWTVFLSIDTAEYALLGGARSGIEEQIDERLKAVIEAFTQDRYSVKLVPRLAAAGAPARPNARIRRQTRQNIIDGLRIDRIAWNGELDDVAFLGRIYNLQALPSWDDRYKDAAGDIYQHRVNNEDWDDDWVYGDTRFGLSSGSDEAFLRFLCETVHPVVRPHTDTAIKLVENYNDQLRFDGWELVEEERIGGRPRFIARRVSLANGRAIGRARNAAEALDAGWMLKEIDRLDRAVDEDPALAIGTAKDLVETCCKSILASRGVFVSRTTTMPELTKLLVKELKLVPEGIPDVAKGAEAIRLLLRNLATITQYLAELRGLYGSGHGRDGKHRGLEPRHARLAVGAAAAFIDFVSETYHQRILPKGSPPAELSASRSKVQ